MAVEGSIHLTGNTQMPKCFDNSKMLSLSQNITSFSFWDSSENILPKLSSISACGLAKSLERLSFWKFGLLVMLTSSTEVRRDQKCPAPGVLGQETRRTVAVSPDGSRPGAASSLCFSRSHLKPVL